MNTEFEKMIDFYENPRPQTDWALEEFYADDVLYVDPITTKRGLIELTSYLPKVLPDPTLCSFQVKNVCICKDEAFIGWNFNKRQRSFLTSKSSSILGLSHLRTTDGKISFQQDYFDLAAALLEPLPLIGGLLSLIKRKIEQ